MVLLFFLISLLRAYGLERREREREGGVRMKERRYRRGRRGMERQGERRREVMRKIVEEWKEERSGRKKIGMANEEDGRNVRESGER